MSQAKDFISKLLVQNPKARMTGKQALQHPWIVKRANLSNEPLGEEITKGLKAYAANNRFERAVRHKMATNLTTAELQHWRNKFEELDTEDTGEIPIAEMQKVLKEGAGEGEDVSPCRSPRQLSTFPLSRKDRGKRKQREERGKEKKRRLAHS